MRDPLQDPSPLRKCLLTWVAKSVSLAGTFLIRPLFFPSGLKTGVFCSRVRLGPEAFSRGCPPQDGLGFQMSILLTAFVLFDVRTRSGFFADEERANAALVAMRG
jgi:hypothetical protein